MCGEDANGAVEAAAQALPGAAAGEDTLCHASTSVYAAGVTVCGRARVVPAANVWIEEEFERLRGRRCSSRLDALFAGADGADCVKFLLPQRGYDNEPMHLYRVEMPMSAGHPMALIDAARRNRGRPDVLREIVEEYWQPTRGWRFREYLGQRMTVVEELDLPSAVMLAGASHRYGLDRDLAARLWP
jgi:hypothetical protein